MELTLYELYQKMLREMEPTGWWPAESKAEIIIGAFMIQNTTQANAERAVANFRKHTAFDPDQIRALPLETMQEYVRPAGFFKNKSLAVANFFAWLDEFADDYDQIVQTFGAGLRKKLLSLRGVGPETADVLLIYVFDQVAFVSDKYARTLFGLLGVDGLKKYDDLARKVDMTGFTVTDAQEFHGLIDEYGKKWLHPQAAFYNSFLGGDQLKL